MPKKSADLKKFLSKIELIEISKIKINPDNPRFIKDERYKKLLENIKSFPQMLNIRPIVINKENIILGGNMRYRACKELKMSEVPIIRADKLTKEEQEKFVVLDNMEFGAFDFDILSNKFDLSDLIEWGFEEKELDLDLWNDKTDEQLDDVPEVQKEAISKLGDLFELGGKHRVLCGDATNKAHVSDLCGELRANLIFIDPPYAVNYGADQDGLNMKSGGKSRLTARPIIGDNLTANFGLNLLQFFPWEDLTMIINTNRYYLDGKRNTSFMAMDSSRIAFGMCRSQANQNFTPL